jgi:hypothetical protein
MKDEFIRYFESSLIQNNEHKGFKIYENRSIFLDKCSFIINNANRNIDILGIDLLEFAWKSDVRSDTIHSLEKGVKIRILIMDPFYSYLPQKETNESFMKNQEEAVKRWLNYRKSMGNRFDNLFQIRIYNDIVNSFLMIVDNRLVFSPYLRLSAYQPSPYLEVEQGEKNFLIIEAYKSHFETIWTESKPIEEYEDYYGA